MILGDAFGEDFEALGDLEGIAQRENPAPSFVVRRSNRFDQSAPIYAFQCIVDGQFEEAIDATDLAFQMLNGLGSGSPVAVPAPTGACSE